MKSPGLRGPGRSEEQDGHIQAERLALPEGTDPKNVAITMLRERVNTKRVSFNRPLVYLKFFN